MELRFKIGGLDCANCAAELERTIAEIDGVKNVVVNFMMQILTITLDEERKDEILDEMRKVVSDEGPEVVLEEI